MTPDNLAMSSVGGTGRVKACTECRQHKLRCDAHQNYSQPCTRCRKMNLSCVVTRQWKRKKRQSKAELVQENDRLRQQLTHHVSNVGSETDVLSSTTSQNLEDHRVNQMTGSPSEPPPETYYVFDAGTSISSLISHLPTAPAEQISSHQIHDAFSLFFRHYAPIIPDILDSSLSPAQYYETSPFLFWAIVTTGARKYNQDPTLLGRASKLLMSIALPSLYSMDSPIPNIQAVLLLCMWPLPGSTSFKDPSYAFAGAASQIAIQSGLHVIGHEQDYLRTHHRHSESEKLLRARIWVLCVITFQSTNLTGGLPFWMSPGIDHIYEQWNLETLLSVELVHRYKIHQVFTTAITALTRCLSTDTDTPTTGLYSLIDLWDTQLQDAIPPQASALNRLVQTCSRLAVRTYHFFADATEARSSGLLSTFSLACKLIDNATALDQSQDLALYSTIFIMRMIYLAAYSILKISRSHLRSHIDLHQAEEATFKAITFARRRSIQPNDLDARNAAILNQLWFSNNIFKRKDGVVDALNLLCRTRLFMSVIFDCCWWWRKEFGGDKYRTIQPEPLSDPNEEQENDLDTAAQGPVVVSTTSSTATSATASPLPPLHQPSQQPSTNITNQVTMQPQLEQHNPIHHDPEMNVMNPHDQTMTTFDTFPDWEWSAGLSYQSDMNLSLPALTIQ